MKIISVLGMAIIMCSTETSGHKLGHKQQSHAHSHLHVHNRAGGFTNGLFDQIAAAYTVKERTNLAREERSKKSLQAAKDHLKAILDDKSEAEMQEDRMAAMKLRMTQELRRSAEEAQQQADLKAAEVERQKQEVAQSIAQTTFAPVEQMTQPTAQVTPEAAVVEETVAAPDALEEEPEMMGFLGKLKQKENEKQKKLDEAKKAILQEAQQQAEYMAPSLSKKVVAQQFSEQDTQEIMQTVTKSRKHKSIAERYQEKLEKEDQDLEDLQHKALAQEQNDMLGGVQDTLRSQGIHISDAELEENLQSLDK